MPKGKPREWPSVEQTRELLQAHGGVPDWHPGFATNSVVDGFSRPELAVWTDEGRLIWRNWDCKP